MVKEYKVNAEITPKDKGFYVKTFQGGVIEVPIGKKTNGDFLGSVIEAVKTQTGSNVVIKSKVEWDEDKENDKRPSSGGSPVTPPAQKKYFKMTDAGFVPPSVGQSIELPFDTNIDTSELSASYSTDNQVVIDFSTKKLTRIDGSENSNFPLTVKLFHNKTEMGSFGLWISSGNVKKSQINYEG